jgi:AraC family ethanolamine operon transcriptional activator
MISNDQQSTLPEILWSRDFTDMSLLGEAIEWDLDFRQLEAGKLSAQAVLMVGSDNVVMRVRFNRKFHHRGGPPPGFLTFGLPDPTAGSLRWNGSEAQPSALLNFNDGRLDGINRRNFGGYTLSFNEDLLNRVAADLGIDVDVASKIRSTAFWNPKDPEHDQLRRKLEFLEHVALVEGNDGQREFAELFNYDLAVSVVRIIGRDQILTRRETARFRTGALKRALRLIDDPDRSPLNVSALCREIGTSLSTLERAFAEEFEVSPKAYMQVKRLTVVRQQIIRSDPEELIADIANRWDFWHMGRFAAEYRKQFGQLPSETSRSRDSLTKTV